MYLRCNLQYSEQAFFVPPIVFKFKLCVIDYYHVNEIKCDDDEKQYFNVG